MKSLIPSLFFFFLLSISSAQTDTVYLDHKWKKCDKQDALYYLLFAKSESKNIATGFDMNNKLKMKAEMKSINPLIKDGDCIYYDEMGGIKKSGRYKDDKQTGLWKVYLQNGKDSTFEFYENDEVKYSYSINKVQEPVYTLVEVLPQYRGGYQELEEYLNDNIEYPASAKKDSIEGRVYVSFVVNKHGWVEDVKLVRGIRYDINLAAVKVVQQMPKWKPGLNDGKKVSVRFNLPIVFHMHERQ